MAALSPNMTPMKCERDMMYKCERICGLAETLTDAILPLRPGWSSSESESESESEFPLH